MEGGKDSIGRRKSIEEGRGGKVRMKGGKKVRIMVRGEKIEVRGDRWREARMREEGNQ